MELSKIGLSLSFPQYYSHKHGHKVHVYFFRKKREEVYYHKAMFTKAMPIGIICIDNDNSFYCIIVLGLNVRLFFFVLSVCSCCFVVGRYLVPYYLHRCKRTENVESQQNSPSLKMCLELLLPIAHHWQNIGVLLEVEEAKLIQIEEDYRWCADCLREMIRAWLKQVNPHPSWRNLADAVEKFDYQKAYVIREKYCRWHPV